MVGFWGDGGGGKEHEVAGTGAYVCWSDVDAGDGCSVRGDMFGVEVIFAVCRGLVKSARAGALRICSWGTNQSTRVGVFTCSTTFRVSVWDSVLITETLHVVRWGGCW